MSTTTTGRFAAVGDGFDFLSPVEIPANGCLWLRAAIAGGPPVLPTNQKAAGSSPAERTTNYLETRCFRLLESTLVSFRTIHLTTYLFPEGFAGRYRALCSGGEGIASTDYLMG